MASCELCGKETNLVSAIVEGSLLSVCNNCSKFGNVIELKQPRTETQNTKPPQSRSNFFPASREIETVIHDYSSAIRKARERKELTQEKLGQALAEKESVIQKIESGQMRPSIALAKKLQQFLGVELLTKEIEEQYEQPLNIKEEGLTIGDLIKMKKIRETEKEPKLV